MAALASRSALATRPLIRWSRARNGTLLCVCNFFVVVGFFFLFLVLNYMALGRPWTRSSDAALGELSDRFALCAYH